MSRALQFIAFVLITTTFEFTYATSIPIVDNNEAFPFLRSSDTPTQVLRWDAGMAIQLLSSCKLIRITRRGVRCIPPHNHLIEGWQDFFSTHLSHEDPPAIIANNPYPWSICTPRNDALCVMRSGKRFFPTDIVRVADSSVNRCINGQGRTLVGQALMNNTKTRSEGEKILDDISLCDILDTNLDIIYDPVNNHIFTRQLGNAIWLYACISIMILAVVVLTAEAVSQQTRSKLNHNIIAWVVLSLLSLLMLTNIDNRMHIFVTTEDRNFAIMTFLYISIITIYWILCVRAKKKRQEAVLKNEQVTAKIKGDLPTTDKIHKEDHKTGIGIKETNDDSETHADSETQKDGINAMIASIHFSTCVLYGTPDNAYVSGFFFLLLFRCLQKIHDAHQNPSQWSIMSNTVLLFDIAYTTGIFTFGVLQHFTSDTESILYAAAQFVICDTITSNYVSNKSSTTIVDGTPVKKEGPPTSEKPIPDGVKPIPGGTLPAVPIITPEQLVVPTQPTGQARVPIPGTAYLNATDLG